MLKFKNIQQSVSHTLRNSRSGRINQFEVNTRLEGLEEKFRILNNDELANAFHDRLRALSSISNRWTPEILAFLLQLSDKPVEKVKVEDLASLKPPVAPAPLTWDDILAEDPLDNQNGLWDDVDFAGDDSNDDEVIMLPQSKGPPTTQDFIMHGDYDSAKARDALVVDLAFKEIDEIAEAQFWRSDYKTQEVPEHLNGDGPEIEPRIVVTETQMVREAIFMLLGLPSTIFGHDSNGPVIPSSRYCIHHASSHSLDHFLHTFAMMGGQLRVIRESTCTKETIPFMQTFQVAVRARLQVLDGVLSEMQARFIAPKETFSTTLLSLFTEIQNAVAPLLQVSKVIATSKLVEQKKTPFTVLELLYDTISTNQSIGDEENYRYMTQLFLECFETYLKPIRIWMDTGELADRGHMFFVKRKEEDLPLASIWSGQYSLVSDSDGKFHAPRFLDLKIKKIFMTGKSVMFMKHLGHDEMTDLDTIDSELPLDYTRVCGSEAFQNLSPFSELFSTGLDKWVANKHRSSSQRLREILESRCGLSRALDALEYIYFSRDGSISNQIADTIFDRMDCGKGAWNDRFILTEFFRLSFGLLSCVDVQKLAIRSLESRDDRQSSRRSVKNLTTLQVNYALPWTVANIVKQQSISTYQRILVFLLQVQRAKYLLGRLQLPKNGQAAIGNENPLIYSLRHRLLWFSNTLQSYLTGVVLSEATAEMRVKLTQAEDLDEMIAVHESYILRLQDQCLLSDKLDSIHQAITSMLDLTILFSDVYTEYLGPKLSKPTDRSAMSQSRPSRVRRKSQSSDDEEQHTDGNANIIDAPPLSKPLIGDRLRKIHLTFNKLCSFVQAGLQGLSRTGAEPCWEVLADMLATGLQRKAGS